MPNAEQRGLQRAELQQKPSAPHPAGGPAQPMGYVDQSLAPGEKVLCRGRISPYVYMSGVMLLFWAAIFVLVGIQFGSEWFVLPPLFLILGLWSLFTAFLQVRNTELAVTSKRVIGKTGIFNVRTVELSLSKVETIVVAQSMGGRYFNFGTVVVVGTGGTREAFRLIADPFAFRRAVHEMSQ